nr:hypothetical protein [Tanacetum cinerariifolium]
MKILIKEILRQTGTVVEYSDAFKSLFGIVSLLSDMGEDETHLLIFSLRDCEESRETVDNNNDSAVLDDCKETESRVSGMDVELKVSEMDDNSNLSKESIESVGYEECCEENVNVKGKEIECANLIAHDELCGGKVKGIEMESDDLVESNEVSKCLIVTDNFVKKDSEIEERNKRMGWSSLICSGDNKPFKDQSAVLCQPRMLMMPSGVRKVMDVPENVQSDLLHAAVNSYQIIGLLGKSCEKQGIQYKYEKKTVGGVSIPSFPTFCVKGLGGAAKLNEVSLRYLEFDIWKWPTRTKIKGIVGLKNVEKGRVSEKKRKGHWSYCP